MIQQLAQVGFDQRSYTESLCSLVMRINVLVVSEYLLLAVSVKQAINVNWCLSIGSNQIQLIDTGMCTCDFA